MFFFIFPGQGSQQAGMGRFLFENFQVARTTFEEASEALSLDIKKLCFDGSEAELALTENTQPAILTCSVATFRVLQSEFSAQSNLTAGHSIGEYASLVLAGAIKFSDAIKGVRLRGRAMQSAVPVGQGGMAAVMGLEPDQVIELCRFVETATGYTPLSAANFNCPGQIVISGNQKALQWLKDVFKPEMLWKENAPKKLKLIPLQVSAPFHCQMMAPAENTMSEYLSTIQFNDAQIPVIQNLTAQAETQSSVLKDNLVRQVTGSVRWMQSMEAAKQMNARKAIECGSGKVLQGLLKKIDPEFFQVLTTNSLEELRVIESFIKQGV